MLSDLDHCDHHPEHLKVIKERVGLPYHLVVDTISQAIINLPVLLTIQVFYTSKRFSPMTGNHSSWNFLRKSNDLGPGISGDKNLFATLRLMDDLQLNGPNDILRFNCVGCTLYISVFLPEDLNVGFEMWCYEWIDLYYIPTKA